MNKATRALRKKGYTVEEFLLEINRKITWWHKHKKEGAKDHDLMMLAIQSLEEK